MRTLFFLLSAVVLYSACTSSDNGLSDDDMCGSLPDSTMQLTHARGFRITYCQGRKIVEVRNPWQGANDVVYRYVLGSESGSGRIRIPVKRVVCLSTTHAGYLSALGQERSVVGFSGTAFLNNPQFDKSVQRGDIQDVGYDQSLRYELLVALKPDVVFVYGVGPETAALLAKLDQIGVPYVPVGEYLETDPLAKTEWVRFFASFYNVEAQANVLFSQIVSEYDSLREIAQMLTPRPKVLVNMPYKGIWYVPGGKSYMANFISDAGGQYLWDSDTARDVISLNIEAVVDKGMQADVWLNPGQALSLAEIEGLDSRLARFAPFEKGAVFNNNARVNAHGGNDVMESGVMQPHVILADLIRIFHPGILADTSLVFHKRLN